MIAPEVEAQFLVDPFLLTHLDEDWAVPCERQQAVVSFRPGVWQPDPDSCGGQNPADWILWSACGCNRSVLYCTPCRDFVLALWRIECRRCDTEFKPATTGFRLIEPLNRRTT